MSGDERTDDNLPADRTAGAASLDDLVGAYLLDALDPADRDAFEAHLRDSAEARAEVAHLRPVIQVLPMVLQDTDDEIAMAPSPGLRARMLDAARADDADLETEHERVEGVGLAPAPERRERRSNLAGDARPGGILAFARRIGIERLAAGFLALVAAGAIIWGVTLQNQLSDAEDDLDSARDELALERGEGEGIVQAVVYALDPTPDGPANANAIVSLQAEDSPDATVSTTGLPQTEAGRAYQLWFLNLTDTGDVEGDPRPGITFTVGADGTAVVEDVPVDAPFDAVAITNEPEDGSSAPTSPILMLGTRGTAAG